MFSILKSHPFAVRAFFERSVVLGYAVPINVLRPHVPKCLQLDTFDDQWGFCAVAMVKTRAMRPAMFAAWMGRDFSLIGYRVFVRYKTSDGRDLRGLYIIRSETDRRFMKLSGNLFTRYNYQLTDVEWKITTTTIGVHSAASKLDVHVSIPEGEPRLPQASPFSDWKEALRFAGPMPYTFSLRKGEQEMVIIKGVRSNWKPIPLEVLRHDVGFLETMGFQDARLANAFVVADVPYLWESGVIDSITAESRVR